jgi:hypothetical protein
LDLDACRLAAGADEVTNRGPAVTAQPGDCQPGRLEADDRDADDAGPRIDLGVALGQQRYCSARRHDLELGISGIRLGGNLR